MGLCGIYKIELKSYGRKYIGSSLDIYERLRRHRKDLRKGSHANKPLQFAFLKHGEGAFVWEPILICSRENLQFYESIIIDRLKTNIKPHGYNIRKDCFSNRGITIDRGVFRAGQRYGRLTVLERHENYAGGKKWKFLCECGQNVVANIYAVKRGGISSCGCLMSDSRQARLSYKNGSKFNKLTLVERSHVERKGDALKHFWKVRCDCGQEKVIDIRPVVAGKTKSCGCVLASLMKKRSLKHGQSKSTEYEAWTAMKSRAKKTGAKISLEWLDFSVFFQDMGARPTGGELLRRDRGTGFSRQNCFWGTNLDLSRNRKSNKYVVLLGEKVQIRDAERRLGIGRASLSQRAKDKNESAQQACDHFARKKGRLMSSPI